MMSVRRLLNGLCLAALIAAAPGGARAADKLLARLKLDGGIDVKVTAAPFPTPQIKALAPSHALWTRKGFSEPVRFDLDTNYAAFVKNWRLIVYRSGDAARRNPLRVIRGEGASFLTGQIWDGAADPGAPALRPGETVAYFYEIVDVFGRVFETEPGLLLAARHVMPAQARALPSGGAARALPSPSAASDIAQSAIRIEARGLKPGERLRLDGLALAPDGKGLLTDEQILPEGRYKARLEVLRARGAVGAQDELAFVAGNGSFPEAEERPLWGDPPKEEAPPARPPARKAIYAIDDQDLIYLPDTDVERDSLRAAVTSPEGEAVAILSAGEHYVLDAPQGRLALTSTGAELLRGLAAHAAASDQALRLEIGYDLLKALSVGAPARSSAPAMADGDGTNFVETYGQALVKAAAASPPMIPAAAPASPAPSFAAGVKADLMRGAAALVGGVSAFLSAPDE